MEKFHLILIKGGPGPLYDLIHLFVKFLDSLQPQQEDISTERNFWMPV